VLVLLVSFTLVSILGTYNERGSKRGRFNIANNKSKEVVSANSSLGFIRVAAF
jgi:hypothetical protein